MCSFICWYVYQLVCQLVCPLYFTLFVCEMICLSERLSICLFVCLLVCKSTDSYTSQSIDWFHLLEVCLHQKLLSPVEKKTTIEKHVANSLIKMTGYGACLAITSFQRVVVSFDYVWDVVFRFPSHSLSDTQQQKQFWTE